ncbi:phosphoenolpyruvate--protein phosphotransferase [Nonomuraea sp. NPDC048916]|uniref:phosphoenolpyruvate--protein phosphotransferase n=1 Tax=Nonomuraea sp. NPDC048916 TaxID=3154232 RepID=UPI003403F097
MNLTGVGASPGIGHGPAFTVTVSVPEPPEGATYTGEADQEKQRAANALQQVAGVLELRGDRVGGQAGEILKAQAMMAEDPGLAVAVRGFIDHGIAAPRAVYQAFARFRDTLAGAGGYLGERAADLDDVRDRVIGLLTGIPMPGIPSQPAPPDEPGGAPQPYVLIAHDLAPADTALLTKDLVAAFVTEKGGPTSHTAILARAMGVPAVVGCRGATGIRPGTRVLVDGTSGEVRVEPPESEVTERAARSGRAAVQQSGGPGRTSDGHAVPLLANIGGPADLDAALAHGAEGIGLYRTEFLFLGRDQEPSADEQKRAYRAALEAFPGRAVVVRVLDAGADKPLAFLPPPDEEPNPALGERGLRLLRGHPEVMEAQLDALTAAAEGTSAKLMIMAPMVTTAEEASWFAGMCHIRGDAPAGVMIEIPAAALRAESLVTVVDFVSIGTNDLAQYTFAADRQLGTLGALQDPWQPALLDLIHRTATAASDNGKPCGICGESAADPLLACVLVGLGATSLSMTATALPAVRAALAEHTLDQCQLAAQGARGMETPAHARAAARSQLPGLARLGL